MAFDATIEIVSPAFSRWPSVISIRRLSHWPPVVLCSALETTAGTPLISMMSCSRASSGITSSLKYSVNDGPVAGSVVVSIAVVVSGLTGALALIAPSRLVSLLAPISAESEPEEAAAVRAALIVV
ncbi:MAG: hypothetical protein OXC00_09470, partial [Acidimicrobiaceae bacterium]|nr:hypothetical protein [Acidimicrobiaceae bacterium]